MIDSNLLNQLIQCDIPGSDIVNDFCEKYPTSDVLSCIPSDRRIAIVGAGLAGLTAARLLSQHCTHVTLFEASERLGGRVDTIIIPQIKKSARVTTDKSHQKNSSERVGDDADNAGGAFWFNNGAEYFHNFPNEVLNLAVNNCLLPNNSEEGVTRLKKISPLSLDPEKCIAVHKHNQSNPDKDSTTRLTVEEVNMNELHKEFDAFKRLYETEIDEFDDTSQMTQQKKADGNDEEEEKATSTSTDTNTLGHFNRLFMRQYGPFSERVLYIFEEFCRADYGVDHSNLVSFSGTNVRGDNEIASAHPQFPFRTIVDKLATPLLHGNNAAHVDLRLNHTVKSVRICTFHRDNKEEITIEKRGQQNNKSEVCLTYSVENVATFDAATSSAELREERFDHVLLAVPLPVLKELYAENNCVCSGDASTSEGDSRSLCWATDERVSDLEAFDMGLSEKIVVEFDESPLRYLSGAHTDFSNISFMFLINDNLNDEKWLQRLSFWTSMDENQRFFYSCLSGITVQEMLKLCKNDMIEKLEQYFKGFVLNESFSEKIKILNVTRTNWTEDSNYLGCYSYPNRKANGDSFLRINCPFIMLGKKLLNVHNTRNLNLSNNQNSAQMLLQIIGEHTSQDGISTMHGAIESAIREVSRLALFYKQIIF